MALPAKKLRQNIERNIARANLQYKKIHGTEAPKRIRDYHEKMIRGAEVERERRENIKRGK
jgi:hypothetical protein